MSTQTQLPAPNPNAQWLKCMPPWFVREGSAVKSKGVKDVNVNFAKPCAGCKMRQQTVSVGKSKGLEKAEKIGAAVARRHEKCHQTVPAPAPNPEAAFLQSQAEIERLERELTKQR